MSARELTAQEIAALNIRGIRIEIISDLNTGAAVVRVSTHGIPDVPESVRQATEPFIKAIAELVGIIPTDTDSMTKPPHMAGPYQATKIGFKKE